MYVVCPEHLDEAIDAFVEEYGTSPDVYLLEKTNFTDWTPRRIVNTVDKARFIW